MKVSHNGVEWCGTFHVTLRAMLLDLLEDHKHGAEDTALRVTVLGPNDEEQVQDVAMLDLTKNTIVCRETAIPLVDVLAVEVL